MTFYIILTVLATWWLGAMCVSGVLASRGDVDTPLRGIIAVLWFFVGPCFIILLLLNYVLLVFPAWISRRIRVKLATRKAAARIAKDFPSK